MEVAGIEAQLPGSEDDAVGTDAERRFHLRVDVVAHFMEHDPGLLRHLCGITPELVAVPIELRECFAQLVDRADRIAGVGIRGGSPQRSPASAAYQDRDVLAHRARDVEGVLEGEELTGVVCDGLVEQRPAYPYGVRQPAGRAQQVRENQARSVGARRRPTPPRCPAPRARRTQRRSS